MYLRSISLSGLLSFDVDISTNLVNHFLFVHNEYLSFSIQWKCFFFLKLLVYSELTPVCEEHLIKKRISFTFDILLLFAVLLVCCIEEGVNPNFFVLKYMLVLRPCSVIIYLFFTILRRQLFLLSLRYHQLFFLSSLWVNHYQILKKRTWFL